MECPAVYVYDAHPGGSELAEGLHQRVAQVLAGCRELVAACECVVGGPSCIGPPAAHAPGGEVPDRGHAVAGTRQELLAALHLMQRARGGGL